MVKRLALLCLLLAQLQGCGWMPWQDEEPDHHPPVPGYVDLSRPAAVRAALLAQHGAWKGVPHRMGGTDRRGLDCSGFAQITYSQRFGVALPRDTAAQRQAGHALPVEQALPGDLLFFDTGIFERHVGIYAGEQQFLHVSTRAGVMLSSLLEPYWSKRLQAAVRVRR